MATLKTRNPNFLEKKYRPLSQVLNTNRSMSWRQAWRDKRFGEAYAAFFELIDSLVESSGMPGTVARDSAASYIDVDGVSQISDGDDTPFSHDSVEDETGYTDIRGSFADDQAWMDGAVLGSELVTNGDCEDGFTSGVADTWSEYHPDDGTFTEVTGLDGTGSAQKVTSDAGVAVGVSIGVGEINLGVCYETSFKLKTNVTDIRFVGFGANYIIIPVAHVINTYTFRFIASSTIRTIYLPTCNTGDWFIVDDFSVKEVTASLADYSSSGNMLIIDDTSAKGYGFIGEVGTGETFTNGNLFDQDGGAGGTGDKGAFTLEDLRLAEVSSGNLTVGTMYEISAQDGEDFTADGAPDNVVGTTFVATGTNVTLDANDKVYPVDISWTPYGTNTMEIDDGALHIVRVDNGNGASLSLSDAADFTDGLEAGKQYKLTGTAKTDNDTIQLAVYDSGLLGLASLKCTDFESFEIYFTAKSVSSAILYTYTSMDAGEEIWLDNLQIAEVTAPSATAVKIYKETTRENEGWNALDTSLDMNAAAWEFDVYKNLMFEYPDLVTNGDFADWTGDNPDGWIVSEVGDATSNVTQSGNACRIISTGTTTQINQNPVMEIGVEYKYSIEVTDVTSGTLILTDLGGGNITLDTVGVYSGTVTANRINLLIRRAAIPCDITFTNIQVAQTDSSAQPRFEANGLLSEGEGTNYCLQSNGFDTTWTGINTVTVADNVTAPDSVANTAWTFTDPAVGAYGAKKQAGIIAPVSGTYTASVFVKEGTSDVFSIRVYDDDDTVARGNIDFQWIAGVLSSKSDDTGTSTVQQLGSTDWWRVQVHCPSIAVGHSHSLFLYPSEYGDTPDPNVTTIFYGAQFEPTAYATSYIPTTTIPVTRTADAHAWTMSTKFKNLMGDVADSPFTMVCEWTPKFDYGDTDAGEKIISAPLDLFSINQSGILYSYPGGDSSTTQPNYTANTNYLFALRVYDDAGTMKFEVGEKHGGSWTWDATPGNYDSSFNPSVNFLIGYLNQYPFNIKNIYFYNNAKTQAWIQDTFTDEAE